MIFRSVNRRSKEAKTDRNWENIEEEKANWQKVQFWGLFGQLSFTA
jgi:hypothetical protein